MNIHVPTLTRREFIRIGGVGVAGYSLLPMLSPLQVEAKEKVEPRGGAEVCILIMLQGAASQVDTFDVKDTPEVPEDFDIRTIRQGLRMPVGTLPRLSERIEKYTIARSMAAWDLNHDRAMYHLQAGREFSVARLEEIPSIGSVVAYEFMDQRKESDILPPFISFDVQTSLLVSSGFMPGITTPLSLKGHQTPPFVLPADEKETFKRRLNLLGSLQDEWHQEVVQRPRIFKNLEDYQQSAALLSDPKAASIFEMTEDDKKRYGKYTGSVGHLGFASVIARNIVEADAGTKFILINHGTWDLHSNCYDKDYHWNQYIQNAELDIALANLLDDLESRTDEKGRRLIDKTFIACVGEFGRTAGPLNVNKGRDHNIDAGIAVFAGAGVQGGRVLGATDDIGAKIVDPGWHKQRPIYPEDVLATIYSVMGIDWTKKITQTPSGRAFEYTEYISPKGPVKFGEISDLFV